MVVTLRVSRSDHLCGLLTLEGRLQFRGHAILRGSQVFHDYLIAFRLHDQFGGGTHVFSLHEDLHVVHTAHAERAFNVAIAAQVEGEEVQRVTVCFFSEAVSEINRVRIS